MMSPKVESCSSVSLDPRGIGRVTELTLLRPLHIEHIEILAVTIARVNSSISEWSSRVISASHMSHVVLLT